MMPDYLKKEMWEAVEAAVKQIALSRKVVDILGESVDDFDEKLNGLCEKWYGRFSDMDILDLSLFMMADIREMEKTKGEDDA